MSILSDKQIRARSMVPTHKSVGSNGTRYYFAQSRLGFYGLLNGAFYAGHEEAMMGSNKLIELTPEEVAGYCAAYPRMIAPFEPELVRAAPDLDAMHYHNFDPEDAPRVRKLAEMSTNLHEKHRYENIAAQLEIYQRDPIVKKVISYGLSSYGYDVRCADEFKVFTNVNSTIVDPKNFDEKSFVARKGAYCIIPPNSFALARTVEKFHIPRDVLTVCLGKSTYARCGIIVNVTPFEPEWEGYVTLEFSNTTPLPAKIYANEGVAQVLFFKSDDTCETSYADRGGKYQGQGAEPVCPKV
jgi:dCTP deaminase